MPRDLIFLPSKRSLIAFMSRDNIQISNATEFLSFIFIDSITDKADVVSFLLIYSINL